MFKTKQEYISEASEVEDNDNEEEKSYNQGDGKYSKDFGLWNY